MAKQRKVPAGPKAQPLKPSGKSASSRKAATPNGIAPASPAYGITGGSGKSEDQLRSRAASLFGNGSRNTGSGQTRLSSKAKRQVG